MKREIIRIDDDKCNGCGNCVPNCHEGALQIIDGKAVLVSDLMCDGLGACMGHCPEDALHIEVREAELYDERRVMAAMVSKGRNVVVAHLKHLKDHSEEDFMKEGISYLWEHRDTLSFHPAGVIEEVHQLAPAAAQFSMEAAAPPHGHGHGHSCPGSRTRSFSARPAREDVMQPSSSELSHWPVQLHLINPAAGYFQGADLVMAADCSAYAVGDFHDRFLRNKKLIIACPKLDHGRDIYIGKVRQLIADAKVNTITVVRMEVPCCGGLLQIVKLASESAGRKVPIKEVVVSVRGEVTGEEWV